MLRSYEITLIFFKGFFVHVENFFNILQLNHCAKNILEWSMFESIFYATPLFLSILFYVKTANYV